MTQIIRARHQRHFHWLGNLHRNHILKHRIPQSHAHIKALFNNIHPAIFDHQFHINLWIFLQKRTQSRIQNPVRHQLAGVNPNRPLRLITQRIQLPNTVLNRLKVRSNIRQQLLAHFRQRHATRSAIKQTHIQPRLETFNTVAQCRR